MDTMLSETSRSSTLKDNLEEMQPCFLFDIERFMKNKKNFASDFTDVFGSKFAMAYSMKTNHHPAILDAVKDSGMMIEIVSPYELQRAINAGFSYDKIVYNGVIPDVEGKFMVASAGGIVNIENLHELRQIAEKASCEKTTIEVGLRVNIKIDENRTWESRFGIDPYSEQIHESLNAIMNPYITITGLHCHVHGCRNLEFWKVRAEKLAEIARKFEVKYIDFGSNMFGYMDSRLESQFDCHIPSIRMYARTIFDGLLTKYSSGDMPMVIVEPGTPIVADTVSVIAKVENISERNSNAIATASCSVYDFGFFHGSDKHPPMDVVHMSDGQEYSDLEIFGYACTEDDTVCKSYSGALAVGDYLIFRNLGAYAFSLSSDFIKDRMPMYIGSIMPV